jgi:arylsulfatase
MAEPSWICCVSACFAGGEGSLRTPCIVQWSGRVVAGQVSDDIMHVTGRFTTILHAAGPTEPTDRIIDPFRHADVLSSCQKDRTVIDSFGNHGR